MDPEDARPRPVPTTESPETPSKAFPEDKDTAPVLAKEDEDKICTVPDWLLSLRPEERETAPPDAMSDDPPCKTIFPAF